MLLDTVPAIVALQARRALWHAPRFSRYTWIALGIVVVWSLVILLSLVDLQVHDRLYSSVAANDYGFRVPITEALARTGPPGFNPFFYPGHEVSLRYHYFWMLLCSLPVRLFGIRALHAMWGATPWCAIALMSMIPLYLKHFFAPPANLRRQSVIGISLLAITGLDIIPTAANFVSLPLQLHGDMEWWNEQVALWMDSVLWNPHHVSALIVCLLGFLLLWNSRLASWRARVVAVLIAGAAFASACGFSVFVTFTFAVFMAAWLLLMLHEQQWLTAALLFLSGVFAIVFALPLLKVLLAPAGGGGGFATFGIRQFYTAIVILRLAGVASPMAFQTASLFALPLNYFFELGFFGVVVLFRFRDVCRKTQSLSDVEKASWTMAAVSLLIATFMQSSVRGNPNDLGWRSILLFQFVALLWAIPFVESWWTKPTQARLRSQERTANDSPLVVGCASGSRTGRNTLPACLFEDLRHRSGKRQGAGPWMAGGRPKPGQKTARHTATLRRDSCQAAAGHCCPTESDLPALD